MVSPVATRVQVMRSVVAIIVRESVTLVFISTAPKLKENRMIITYRNINQCDAREVIRIRIGWIHKSMLTPITNHQAQAHNREGKNKHEGGSASIDVVVQHINGNIVAYLPESTSGCILKLTLSPKIQWKFQPNEENESTHVSQEVGNTIAVVVHCCAQVIPAITLDMVMLDVVVEV